MSPRPVVVIESSPEDRGADSSHRADRRWWRGYPSRFLPGYGLISYSYRYLTSPSNGVYPWRPRWGQSIIRRGVSVGVVDSRGSEPWVLGGHGYERASWVMVLHQSGLICRGVLAFLFRLAVVPYPTSVGFVRVVPVRFLSRQHVLRGSNSRTVYLVSSLLHLCSIQHLSSSALLSSIFLVVSSLCGFHLSAVKATSSFHWLAPAGIHSQWICPSHNNSLLISCPLFISICTSHNVTVTQSCFLLTHIPVATRGHSG